MCIRDRRRGVKVLLDDVSSRIGHGELPGDLVKDKPRPELLNLREDLGGDRRDTQVTEPYLSCKRDLLLLVKRLAPPSLLDDCLLYTSDAADDLLCVDLG